MYVFSSTSHIPFLTATCNEWIDLVVTVNIHKPNSFRAMKFVCRRTYSRFEAHFGRERVRAWQPFEAVARGAAVFAGGQAVPQDFLVHDYALVTHRLATKEAGHTVVIPRGTRFPTAPDFWKRQLVPTCALGEPQDVFKLVICELGSTGGVTDFVWDADGKLRRLTADDPRQVVVELNGGSPAMGELSPPQKPGERAPRLEVSLGVNAERWLCSRTVVDLRTRQVLMRDQPVVRIR